MRVLLLLCLVWPAIGLAQVPPILQALRQNDWNGAQALAGPDPLGQKLVTFIRLLNPGQAGAAELHLFITENPGWPDQDTLQRRYAEAVADTPDERTVALLCTHQAPGSAPALLRCAEAWALAGDPSRAIRAARQAWTLLQAPPAAEDDVLARWGAFLTAADQLLRFERLENTDGDAAARQLARLDPAMQRLGTARLAFRRRDPDALATLTAVPVAMRNDSLLLLAEARYLRRAGEAAAALALWRTALPQAEAAIPGDRRAFFWAERDALARDLLAAGGDKDAFYVADDRLLPPDQAVDSDFLAGWIALRRLNDAASARLRFAALARISPAAITQARAHYWLARASSDPAIAAREFTLAGTWPTTYYGQLALREAGMSDEAIQSRVAALRDPPAAANAARTLEVSELARAAALLVSWADPRRAADFLRQSLAPPASDTQRALIAALALRLKIPDVAVQAARLAGRDGVVLAGSGWPVPVQPQAGPAPPFLVLGLMRQESSFDVGATSAVGARGLMQLMPATAAQVARATHAPAGPLSDPDINMRLGSAYLATLLAQFGGIQVFAIAAYNAGPRHVRDWLLGNGDPKGERDATIDWIELIPFAETRNYVQRVLENATIYRARLQGAG